MLDVEDVHRAALALAVPGGLAEQLGHDHPRVGAAGQRVAVIAVGAELVVVRAERLGGADRDRLLADVEVAEAVDLALGVGLRCPLLEPADEVHVPVHREQECLSRYAGAMRRPSISARGRFFQAITACRGAARSSQVFWRLGLDRQVRDRRVTPGSSVDTRPEWPVATSTTSASGEGGPEVVHVPGLVVEGGHQPPQGGQPGVVGALEVPRRRRRGRRASSRAGTPGPGRGNPKRREHLLGPRPHPLRTGGQVDQLHAGRVGAAGVGPRTPDRHVMQAGLGGEEALHPVLAEHRKPAGDAVGVEPGAGERLAGVEAGDQVLGPGTSASAGTPWVAAKSRTMAAWRGRLSRRVESRSKAMTPAGPAASAAARMPHQDALPLRVGRELHRGTL